MSSGSWASDAERAGDAYVRSLLELLGTRDPFDVQGEVVPAIERALAGLDHAVLRCPERPGKWSILEVVQHLADNELVYGYRVRMILTHDAPLMERYDRDAWARALRYNELEVGGALEQLRVLRAANLRLLRGLSEAQLDRVGVHRERGAESVRTIIKLVAGHDLLHRRQIERIKSAVVGSREQAGGNRK